MTAQVVSDAEAPTSVGNWGTSGITKVCMSETTIPARASTTTMVFARGGPAVREGTARSSSKAEASGVGG